MSNNSFGDFFGSLFKNAVPIEPRALRPLKKGGGMFEECVERYVQLEAPKHGFNIENVTVMCSSITKKEEELFNKLLGDFLFNPNYTHGNKLYVILDEVSDLFCMNHTDIVEGLNGLGMAQVKIKSKEEEGSFHISSLFLQNKTNFYIDSEDSYYVLKINQDFLNACYEVKMEM
ncbi:hypothetical protein [Halobacillus sp. KGW1]|uniref:hypothetical protein n=1 Tax=Halobacillus sp. KGW1 TaxID=1793726 RepID=UPI0007812410|nr:hypothetical protein [Halobacillus sp. KGW1]